MLAVSIAMVLVALIGCSTAVISNVGYDASSPKPISFPATLGYPNAYEERNTTFDFEQSVQGNGYFMTYLYAKAGNVAVKNYAHGSGSINNEAILTYQKLNRSTRQAYGDYNDFDLNCIQFKEDNAMVYAPMRIAVGTGYYAAYPLDYSSLLKERTELKNYRAGTSMLHEVEYAHALDKELELTGKETFNYTYDPEKVGVGYSQMKINEDVTDGKAHIGVLQAGDDFANQLGRSDLTNIRAGTGFMFSSALKKPSILIDEDYWGTYHIEKNMTIEVPYHLIQKLDDWLPCCFGGFSDLSAYDQKIFKSAKGIFDCTCFKAPTQAQFPRVYN